MRGNPLPSMDLRAAQKARLAMTALIFATKRFYIRFLGTISTRMRVFALFISLLRHSCESRNLKIAAFAGMTMIMCLLCSPLAHAGGLLRDAEIEHTLRMFTNPILEAADIEPKTVRIFIVNDPAINAFVAGGLNIFIHTGLIMNATTPDMLIGVIAHETGHISGAHLSQLSSASQQASIGAILSTIIGAATVAAGGGEAGGAIISAGQNTSLRNMLSYVRGNEQQADQAAVTFLEAIGMSPKGMLDMFQVLRRNEKKLGGTGDPYLRTHPLSSERIAVMRSAVNNSRFKPENTPKEYARWHSRMVAKLFAFLEDPKRTFEQYPESDTSEAGLLARAVAHFRNADFARAGSAIDSLVALSPDAFIYDLKGQILFESGKVDEARQAYETGLKLLPDNSLMLTDLARCLIAKEDKNLLPTAIAKLEKSARLDDTNSNTFRQLAIAYGGVGKIGESNVALAHEAELNNSPEETLHYAKLAQKTLSDQSPAWFQAEDLITEAKRLLKDQNKSRLLF